MGCGVSRIDTNGMAFTARLRPIFPDISVKKHIRSTTMSKKKLLSHKSDISDGSKTAPSSLEGSVSNGGKFKEPQQKEAERSKDEASARENGIATSSGNEINVTKKEISGENVIKDNEDYTSEDVFTDADNGEEDEDDNDRMIGQANDEAFIGSPSFRIYYKDNTEDEHDDEIGKNDCFEDAMPYVDDVSVSPKESSESEDKKSNMRKKRRRSFKKVFPKGRQVKSLLSMKSCYCSPYSSHNQTHLLRERTNA